MNTYLRRVISWLRQGYPAGPPATGYQPLLALVGRRLTDDEVVELGDEFLRSGTARPGRLDIAAGMTKVTDTLPSPQEVSRVCERLREMGFPVDVHAGGLS